MTNGGMVIVGAGEAGAAAAIGLREAGWSGPVTLIGDEPHLPYERPPLSKAVLLDEGEPALPTIGHAARFEALGIAHRPGLRVEAIRPAQHELALAGGGALPYERLLLATGARARPLAIPGGDAALLLRGFSDALAIRDRLGPGRRLVVIGGGFIGLELAAAARERGTDVTVVEAAPRILMRGVPEPLAAIIADRHRAAGVDLLTGVGIAAIERQAAGFSVILSDGTRIETDCVVAGIGAAPDVALAAAAGLALDNGIAVDDRLATSDPDIFAAGDCCSFPHPLYGGRRIRLEAWRNAQEQGAGAARSMLGTSEPYAAVPWFWSDQYDLHLQIAGLPGEATTTVARDAGPCAQILFHLAPDGRLLAASGVGPIGRIAKEIRLAEKLVAAEVRPDPADLASPDVKLKALLAA